MSDEMEKVIETLEGLGLEYKERHDGEQVVINGYGRVYYDDQPGVEPGLVVEGLDGDGQPIEVDEAVAELRMAVTHAGRERVQEFLDGECFNDVETFDIGTRAGKRYGCMVDGDALIKFRPAKQNPPRGTRRVVLLTRTDTSA